MLKFYTSVIRLINQSKEIVEKQFSVLGSRGSQNSLSMHVYPKVIKARPFEAKLYIIQLHFSNTYIILPSKAHCLHNLAEIRLQFPCSSMHLQTACITEMASLISQVNKTSRKRTFNLTITFVLIHHQSHCDAL